MRPAGQLWSKSIIRALATRRAYIRDHKTLPDGCQTARNRLRTLGGVDKKILLEDKYIFKTISHKGKMSQKMMIDVDTGVDDSQAIMLALGNPDVDVLAITVVSGNTHVNQACLNTLKVVKLCGKLGKVPVYRGSEYAILGGNKYTDKYHGSNGLGGLETAVDDPGDDQLQPQNAVLAMIDLVNKYPGEITLVALAPLTNICLAIRLDPNFTSKLKDMVIMGGNLHGIGNIVVSAEFNFYEDPEAAFVVLNNIQCPTKILGWEPCLACQHPWDWYKEMMEINTKKAEFVKKTTKMSADRLQKVTKQPFWHSCDFAAMAIAINKHLIVKSEKLYCTVELIGQITRGQMIVDYNDTMKREKNLEVLHTLDYDKVREDFKNMLLL